MLIEIKPPVGKIVKHPGALTRRKGRGQLPGRRGGKGNVVKRNRLQGRVVEGNRPWPPPGDKGL